MSVFLGMFSKFQAGQLPNLKRVAMVWSYRCDDHDCIVVPELWFPGLSAAAQDASGVFQVKLFQTRRPATSRPEVAIAGDPTVEPLTTSTEAMIANPAGDTTLGGLSVTLGRPCIAELLESAKEEATSSSACGSTGAPAQGEDGKPSASCVGVLTCGPAAMIETVHDCVGGRTGFRLHKETFLL